MSTFAPPPRTGAGSHGILASWIDDGLSSACSHLTEEAGPSEPTHMAAMRSEIQLRACSNVLDWLGLALIDMIEVDLMLAGQARPRSSRSSLASSSAQPEGACHDRVR